jgi:hypothetical protein
MSKHIVLLHGYSDCASSLEAWRDALIARCPMIDGVHVASFETLSNELRIADIAEALEWEVRRVTSPAPDPSLSFVVHSTGMLVVREWLRLFPERRAQLTHLIGLAPATFGSPLAHRGRSWLGAALKGNRELGPDFLEAGDQILSQLEVGSRYLWDLAHFDLVGSKSFFRRSGSPVLVVFCGDRPYSGLRGIVSPPGSDGTVRFAGASPRARKGFLDLTEEGNRRRRARGRFLLEDWPSEVAPLLPAPGLNHASILTSPSDALINDAVAVLGCPSRSELGTWLQRRASRPEANPEHQRWMQLVAHAIDDRGSDIDDFYLEIVARLVDGTEMILQEPDIEVHRNQLSPSFLALHFDSGWLARACNSNSFAALDFRVIASSGTQRIGYIGYGSEKLRATSTWDRSGKWDAVIDVTRLAIDPAIRFFEPCSTTLLEIRLDRQPLPIGRGSDVLRLESRIDTTGSTDQGGGD